MLYRNHIYDLFQLPQLGNELFQMPKNNGSTDGAVLWERKSHSSGTYATKSGADTHHLSLRAGDREDFNYLYRFSVWLCHPTHIQGNLEEKKYVYCREIAGISCLKLTEAFRCSIAKNVGSDSLYHSFSKGECKAIKGKQQGGSNCWKVALETSEQLQRLDPFNY